VNVAEQDWVYGMHAVAALVAQSPERVALLRMQEGRVDQRMKQLLAEAEAAGIAVEWLPRAELDRQLEGRHQGVAARLTGQIDYREADLEVLLARVGTPFLLVLDGVTDPHNLGACLRSADAAGVTAVIAPRDKAAGLTPVVRKVACGAAESVPFVQVTNLARTLKRLQELGVWIVGTTGEAERSLFEQELTGPLALVMGAEGGGMRRLTKEGCDFLVNLPMAGSVSSLNGSVATGICLFEAVRQRLAAVPSPAQRRG
jgi:23S rRNA (guanosine2251-2'-O)-methyltransferase